MHVPGGIEKPHRYPDQGLLPNNAQAQGNLTYEMMASSGTRLPIPSLSYIYIYYIMLRPWMNTYMLTIINKMHEFR